MSANNSEQLLKIGVQTGRYPQYIYKYRADNENTEKIIKNDELWFSSPSDFNDPYDCNVPIDKETPLNIIKGWLQEAGAEYANFANELQNELQNNPEQTKRRIEQIMKQQTEKVMAGLGVCCFSTMDNSILQWSHYSDNHKGVCLQFDIMADIPFFITPVIVAYRKVMQHYNHFNQEQRKNIVDYLIKPKFHEWSYESEIRVVKKSIDIEKNPNKRAFKFNSNALKEVIFGVKTDETVIQKYKQWCAAHNKQHVKFYKMELGRGVHYELIKYPIQ